ncbi:disulfide bond formation protein DsbC [Bordetella genomosp. 1]|uniref:Thiol:disulfide interchange protein n=1 Tax=Bordetella genomosp. 1 TaxID=1395607 RepID=A0A261STS4_9BORD|nr:DsbC family protein [Bordetella genomosp. 1]MDQ8035448.1 DsbC family protein [Bordetella sp.]OZI40491.1 disulfide bond formation protein DsbC [Bordetella genomosp. 1]
MNIRHSLPLACALALAAAGAHAADKVYSTANPQAPAAGDKVTSTNDIGQPAKKGEKVYSTASVTPPDPVADEVKSRFKQRFTNFDVTTVRRTPYGLFEVQVGMDLIYTDEKVTWVMEGPLIDAMTRRDVTSERQEKLGQVEFDQLPLDQAIKQVKGDGSRKVAIFEDPNCGYCKQLRHTLEDVDNITVYTFLYPILSPDSTTKVRDIWCASDPGKSWDDWMLRGKRPASVQCDAPIDQMVALGRQLMVRGTPTLFFADGSRASGALPLDQLQERLK